MGKPLDGIKVIDLSTFVAAPVTGRFLADLGAEVIKIETASGDGWRITGRGYVPDHFTPEDNPVFDIYNSGKKLISVNLKTKEGKEVFRRLMEDADIFLTNVREDALRRMGVSYEDLKEQYPKLIYAQVTGYGPKGPEAATAAFDTTAFWSRTGFIRDLGVIDEETGAYNPVYPPSGVGDTVTAYLLLSQINAALYQRTSTGRGQRVEASLFHTGIFTMGTMQVTCQRPFGRVYPKERYDHASLAGFYRCSDGEYIFIAAGVPQILIKKLGPAIGIPDLADDPRFATVEARAKYKKEVYTVLKERFLTKTSDEWLAIAKQYDFAATKCQSFADIAEDEQAIANDYVEKVLYPNGNVNTIATPPFHMETVQGLTTRPMPKAGTDTRAVLLAHGYTDEEIDAMKDSGAVFEA